MLIYTHVRDKHTNGQFLIDTGSEVRVTSPTPANRTRTRTHSTRTLVAVNNSPIRTYGQRSLARSATLAATDFRYR